MGKPGSDATTSMRKRQLNVIYFIDAAKTRSFTMSLTTLNIALAALGLMAAWSVASIAVIFWMVKTQDGLATRLQSSFATLFEYETRHDGVYDIAYPANSRPSEAVAVVADATAATDSDSKSASAEAKPAKATSVTPKVAAATEAPAPAKAAAGIGTATTGTTTPTAATATADKAAETTVAAENPPQPAVAVGNPVLEAGDEALELRFDLTSKMKNGRSEGYVWAIAEFRTDDGESIYIGAPSAIQVKANGEPSYPQRSAIFGIRRFKKKVFRFPLVKDRPGTFVGVRIGVSDRSGGNRTTYNVPVEIRVGAKADAKGAIGQPNGSKPG